MNIVRVDGSLPATRGSADGSTKAQIAVAQRERRAAHLERVKRREAQKQTWYNRQRDVMPPAEFHEVNQVSYRDAQRAKDGRWVLIAVMIAVIGGLAGYVLAVIMEVIR